MSERNEDEWQKMKQAWTEASQANAPDGCASENNFARSSAVMAAYSSRIAPLTAVLKRRRAKPVNARRAVLRGQKMASTTTLVSFGLAVAADELANQGPVLWGRFRSRPVRVDAGKGGAHFRQSAGFLLFAQEAEGFAHDFAGVAELAGGHLAGDEFFPSRRQ